MADSMCFQCGETFQLGSPTMRSRKHCYRCRPVRSTNGSKHGTDRRYAQGCRCDPCRVGKRDRQRAYNAMVKARDGLSPTQKQRPRGVPKDCEVCGEQLSYANRYATAHRRCRADKSWWIPDLERQAVYERDGFVCQLCDDPVDVNLDSRDAMSATLDHIVPRSLGGLNEPANLRLAHRSCNSKRGNRVEEDAA